MNSINLHKNTTLYIIAATSAHTVGHSTKKSRAAKEADMRARQTGQTVTVHTESGLAAGKPPVYTAEPPAAKVEPAPAPTQKPKPEPKPVNKPVKKPAKPVAITRPVPTPVAVKKAKEYSSKFVGNGGQIWDAPKSFEKRGFIRRAPLDIVSPVQGWEVLYSTPKKQEYLLRAVDRAEYAFYCTATDENGEPHDTFRPLNSQSETKPVGRTAWCDKCGVKKARKANLATA